jgi:Fe-S-cluster containining protein
MHCGGGCAQCCRGLFDIALPDALVITHAFILLDKNAQREVAMRAHTIHQEITRENPELKEDFFLSKLPIESVDRIVEHVGDVGCPFLDAKNFCLIYDSRPMACRLEGIPMVDAQDGLFGDWCELNFKEGISQELKKDLCLDYYEIQTAERAVTADVAQYFLPGWQPDATIFIPSAIVAADILRALAVGTLGPEPDSNQ